jgi:hypothetical protein
MRRLLIGIIVGASLGWAVDSQARAQAPIEPEALEEATLQTASGAAFAVPQAYGRLASVVVSSDVHYLYFEDGGGAIRIVPIGPRGAMQRSRSVFQLLSSDVPLIRRGAVEPLPAAP